MPIITPAYPSMCATFNITKSTMAIIQRELQRGAEITDSVMVSKRPWSDLFVKHTFFTSGYKYYIAVITASKSKEAHKVWSGYVESKVRVLVQGLEQHPSIALAQPFTKGYDRQHQCRTEEEVAQVQDGSLDHLVRQDARDVEGNSEAGPAAQEGSAHANSEAEQKPKAEDGDSIANPDPNENLEANSSKDMPIDVFTTTHYIGLELKEGEWHFEERQDQASTSTVKLLIVVELRPSLTSQAPNHLIFRTKSTALGTCAASGRSTRRSSNPSVSCRFNTFASKFLATENCMLRAASAYTSSQLQSARRRI